MLNKDQILACKDIQSEEVDVPEWDGKVRVQGLTLAEKDDWEASVMTDGKPNIKGASAKLCILCMRNETDDDLLFSLNDVLLLQDKSAAAINRIFQVAQRLSGIGQEDSDETVKNSEKTQKPASG